MNMNMTEATSADTAVAVAAMDYSGPLGISPAKAEALAAVDAHHHDASNVNVPVLNTTTSTGRSSRSHEKWEQHFQRLFFLGIQECEW